MAFASDSRGVRAWSPALDRCRPRQSRLAFPSLRRGIACTEERDRVVDASLLLISQVDQLFDLLFVGLLIDELNSPLLGMNSGHAVDYGVSPGEVARLPDPFLPIKLGRALAGTETAHPVDSVQHLLDRFEVFHHFLRLGSIDRPTTAAVEINKPLMLNRRVASDVAANRRPIASLATSLRLRAFPQRWRSQRADPLQYRLRRSI